MKKPVIIILGGLLLGLIGAGTYLLISGTGTQKNVPDITNPDVTPSPAIAQLNWDDPAGFTLNYPETLRVDKHEEDKMNYAHVEFTDPSHPGKLIVWVKDLPKGITDTISWGKKMATPSAAISFETVLGGKPAQKILISQPAKSVTVGTVYDGVLWYIESELADDAYWQPVYDSLVNSFVFKPLPTSAASAAGADSYEGSVDEEEVLE